jgi:hypothetical protein
MRMLRGALVLASLALATVAQGAGHERGEPASARLAQATQPGTGTGPTEVAACRAARAAAVLACVQIGRDGDPDPPCDCHGAGAGWTCRVDTECIPKW